MKNKNRFLYGTVINKLKQIKHRFKEETNLHFLMIIKCIIFANILNIVVNEI